MTFFFSFSQPMETNNALVQFRPRTGKLANAPLLLEVEVYLHLLVVIYLIDIKKYAEVRYGCFTALLLLDHLLSQCHI